MVARLPKDKLEKYRSEVKKWSSSHYITLRELQSLTGKLQFATCVIKTGRAFLTRLYTLTKGQTNPDSKIRITQGVREDLKIWIQFLDQYNGTTIINVLPKKDSECLHFFSDASKREFGATFGATWVHGIWPERWKKLDIMVLEMYPIYLMISLYSSQLANTHVVFHTDNLPNVYHVNNKTSSNSDVMRIIRPLVLVLLTHNIHLTARHIPGIKNVLSDAISRSQVTKKLLKQFGMHQNPLTIPPHLLPENFAAFKKT
ncbi:uncharacterized protein [Antedon mediterranea]|uniref:uncharacterized protein n=1 Tax=Antedon mediterranea TaxID=105859 RepID=UPI003AF648B0